MTLNKNQDIAKEAAAHAAAELVQDDMMIGLGTGSTAKFLIQKLIERHREGLRFQAVASSERSAIQAAEGGIKLYNLDAVISLDLTIDGADEIDLKKQMIKGGGGALLREKILASISKEMVVIVDETKVVKQLGAFPLPLEVSPFAANATLNSIKKLGYNGAFRYTSEGKHYITDNGNYIVDIKYPHLCQHPEKDNEKFLNIPGVLGTGFFLNMAGRVFVGHNNGAVSTL